MYVLPVNKRSRWLVIVLFPVAMQNTVFPYSKSSQHYYTDRCQVTGISGLELLSYINEMDSKIPVILITGHGDVEMAVDAMRNGAFDFIEKPSSSDKLLSIIARAVEKRRLVLENQQLLANLQQENGPVLIGRSPQMQQLRKMILNVADTGADVLIYGETGCGKEVVARMLHHWSTRRQGSLLP